MSQIDLQEHTPSELIPLSQEELDALLELNQGGLNQSLDIRPVPGSSNSYRLTPGSVVGAVESGNLSLLISPKIGIGQLLSLACYAMGKFRPQERDFDFGRDTALPDVLALALNAMARQAFARGLLHGYLRKEEALYTVRGRIRFDAQLRRRFNIPLPVEVRYNEFTEDILANRLVKAAAYRLGGMRLRSTQARSGLAWVAGMLDKVSLVEFPVRDVPEVEFDRLNEHYRGVVALSRLILRHSAFEAQPGRSAGYRLSDGYEPGFSGVCDGGVAGGIGASERTFGEDGIGGLDVDDRIKLRPDLVWRDGGFVGLWGMSNTKT